MSYHVLHTIFLRPLLFFSRSGVNFFCCFSKFEEKRKKEKASALSVVFTLPKGEENSLKFISYQSKKSKKKKGEDLHGIEGQISYVFPRPPKAYSDNRACSDIPPRYRKLPLD